MSAPLPTFFDRSNAYNPNYRPRENSMLALATQYRRDTGIKPYTADALRGAIVNMAIIDGQNDFCFPPIFDTTGEQTDGGTLYVGGRSGTGAMDDNARLAEFIYRNMGLITYITCTLDSHYAFMIFFATAWVTKDGKPLSPHTLIVLAKDGKTLNNIGLDGTVLNEDVGPNPVAATFMGAQVGIVGVNEMKRYYRHYVEMLAKGGLYTLYLWPLHTQIGTWGHNVAGVIREAHLFHGMVRNVQPLFQLKGTLPLSERYGVFAEEVDIDHTGRQIAQVNTGFVTQLAQSDATIFAGQAASHCVKSSIGQFLRELAKKDPELAKRIYIMKDCMSSVAVPDGKGGFLADFTPQAEQALDEFARAGMNVVESTTPLRDWPGVMSKIAA